MQVYKKSCYTSKFSAVLGYFFSSNAVSHV